MKRTPWSLIVALIVALAVGLGSVLTGIAQAELANSAAERAASDELSTATAAPTALALRGLGCLSWDL